MFDWPREDRTAKDMPPETCLQCREEFESKNRLHNHITTLFWASIHERQYPKKWSPFVMNYVRRAMDPVNEPGWSNADIVRELKSLIEADRVVAPGRIYSSTSYYSAAPGAKSGAATTHGS